MTEEEKEAEGIRLIQEYLARRREKEQVPGTQEYEIEQMVRKVREGVAVMSPQERYESQRQFHELLAQIRAEMGLPPKDIEEFVPGENTTVTMWKSYLIRTYLDQGACRALLVGLNFDR
jgi:hypothetical protein